MKNTRENARKFITEIIDKTYPKVFKSDHYLAKALFEYTEYIEASTPTLTPEKLGELFDAKAVAWDEVSPGSKVMESQEFIEIAQELTSQPRQPETEINLPTNEAVKEWFSGCANDNDLFWTNEYSSKQVLDEIIKALKYFIVTWQPVRNSKQSQPEQPEIDCAEMSFNEHFEKKQTEIPEDRLRQELIQLQSDYIKFVHKFNKDAQLSIRGIKTLDKINALKSKLSERKEKK